MWVVETKNGKFKFVERYNNPLTGKEATVSITTNKNTASVHKRMPALLQKKIDRKLNNQNKHKQVTFKQLSDEWLAFYKKSANKQSTYTKFKSNLIAVNDELGDALVDKLRGSDFNKFFLEHLQSGRFVYNTAVQIKSNITQVLAFGKTYYDINTRPIIDDISVPKLNVSEVDQYNYLEHEELSKIIKYLDQHNYLKHKRMVTLQVSTGLRFGEMASIDFKEDIDFENKSININKTFDYDNKVFTDPKDGQARTIYFNDSVEKVLREQIQETMLLTMSRAIPKDNTLLFKSIHGNVIQHKYLNDMFKKIDIGKHVTTHTLRHTFVSLAVENGMNKDLIAKQVGHADTKMINQIYSHFTEGMKKKQKEAMLDFKII